MLAGAPLGVAGVHVFTLIVCGYGAQLVLVTLLLLRTDRSGAAAMHGLARQPTPLRLLLGWLLSSRACKMVCGLMTG